MGNQISIRELARKLNVAPNSVMRAISAGKVDDCYDSVAKKFDWKKAQKNEWVQSASVIKAQRGVSVSKAIEKIDRSEKIPLKKEKEIKSSDSKKNIIPENVSEQEDEGERIDELSEEELTDRIKLTENMPIQQAMRYKEIIDAAINKIKLKQLQSILVPKADVEKAYYNYAAQFKKALLQIPDIISDDVMSAENKVEVMNIIKKSLVSVMEEYSKAPEIQID